MGDLTGADFPAHEQMPAAGVGLGLIPDPDPGLQVLSDQWLFLTPAQAQALPGLSRLGGGPVVDPHRGRLRLGAQWAAPASRPRGHLRCGILKINRKYALDAKDKVSLC
ncbi:hypothetical protein [uncultured Thiodictyon sp.]|uniref:hypothetical protein n=1 Tax=uncultured Thiodictyon sp. TaxID=1846217 RepID=UPI0025DBCFC4|nr:hypothetical protein [uncultured Thiodictyon sp.]